VIIGQTRSMRGRAACRIVAATTVAALACGCASASTTPAARKAPAPVPLARIVGQLMLVRMQGKAPSSAFRARIRRGEIGGVVLFADNYGPAGPAALVAQLQRIALDAGQPRLLIAIDQEGGVVRRLPGAPTLRPSQMTNARIAGSQGLATAQNLKRNGIGVDLAPVLDVGRGGFITERTFGSTPLQVANRGSAFARGLASGGVIATGKHFPGLGYAESNTDNAPTIVRATRAQLLADLLPYRRTIAEGLKIVLVATAVYPALGDHLPAVCSPRVVTSLLRHDLGFGGLVITDDLNTPGVTHFLPTPDAAVHAVAAGVDMVLTAGLPREADRNSTAVYSALVAAATNKTLSRRRVAEAYAHVLALKRG
jgi:beta-N-acetylhexosaminidase